MIEATRFHAEAMAAIHEDAFPVEARWDALSIASLLQAAGTFGWLCEAGGFVMARTAGDEAEILTLAVLRSARRSGLGQTLLMRGMATAKARGAVSIVLEVGAANLAARALYTTCGFRPVGRRARYYPGGEDALILRAAI